VTRAFRRHSYDVSKSAQAPRLSLRRRRWRFVLLALVVAVGIQIPLIAALGALTGHLLIFVVPAVALTIGFLSSMLGGRSMWSEPGPARLYGVLWPFFAWWTVALLFALLAPFLLGLAQVSPMTRNAALAVGVGLAVLGAAGAVGQRPRLRTRDIPIVGLPHSFDGFRVAQISDLHCGPFASGARVAEWVAQVNRLQPDLIAVTGDLIANGATFVPVVAAELGKLRAPAGVFASMGNHDYFTDGEALATAVEQAGLTMLRNRGVEVSRGDGRIFVAGVDDTWTQRQDFDRALAERPEGMSTVLLAHDPALFPEAAARGVDLTLSGHTHGGQFGVPFLARRLNLARLITRFTTGFYRLGDASLYVNRGLGTTGPPVRVGVRPEIGLLTLRRA
jgi:predicted MPP superfamily phosphohydrolase